MTPFTAFAGIAAPFPMANVDTDTIVPARFMKTVERSGLGRAAFADLRFESDGSERPDFVLNQPQFRDAEIVIAYENFGCGSSREHAPWALRDYGIRCIIAPSFADIFHNNSFKNGLLLISLEREICDRLMNDARMGGNARFGIDLAGQLIVPPNGEGIKFEIDPTRKHKLLNGIDDIGETLIREQQISAFEDRHGVERAWLFGPVVDESR
ncbi:3-isopropylmalate/(R)-2-methylmalate dehydratase small subunit [Methylobacterium sp. PvP062]|uniref:3-isopropylmalate dehydratase small subunit n=1 Tax=Methylobacterium radiotolerans TaxID=31998 RepID=A0ABV2NTU0_9HYPH|nr:MULTISPECIES: 3-isopropylmalate dehydratase small subunit [unclassified Methylobacterium]MBP2498304.1 3-isopropylmalate/(R)-2-methylmalate dehydratase small subunit [Methylobacterium sp. PvP105]MBP2505688.1 3-isopropylmalate/(R)-2-methylmalate dehydratase small subunit [Methylobacterium sp. PvP109]